jgi:predicted metal-binding protein
MNIMENKFQSLIDVPISLGAYKANVIETEDISLDRAFRDMCASNACGMYGKCWMCPPDVGDIDVLMGEVGKYDYALVYQTVTELEDSYDFEGMIAAKKRSYPLAQSLRKIFDDPQFAKVLHLGAGGCGVCNVCAKRTDEPCRFPEKAMPSLESYGVNVSELAKASGMKYINGQDTVTYFGAVLFSLKGENQ